MKNKIRPVEDRGSEVTKTMDQTWGRLCNRIGHQTRKPVSDEICCQIVNQVFNQVWSQVHNQVFWEQVSEGLL